MSVHFDDELPGNIELSNLGHDVDEEVVGGRGEGRVRERFGIVEKRESDFGVVFDAEEGLGEKVRGEGDAVELERRFHGVERVVVLEEDL